ncbi:hypothetical protein FCM35_KLT17010 [Carex littledalei]|uniref:Uncharacterized protein n=1 Tax=Carex littledalei TaxID=544730 RepID=A0A833VWE3_9POAL|nr:hypothetical protein FCM35_KLT17010 [Carex littledalei]
MDEPPFSITPVPNAHQRNELYFKLYLQDTYLAPNDNQSIIVDSDHPNAFGRTETNGDVFFTNDSEHMSNRAYKYYR